MSVRIFVRAALYGCWKSCVTPWNYVYSRVSFYDDSLFRPLSSRTEHFRLVVHHCRNSSALSLLSALLALFRCARVSSLHILVQFFFKLMVIFPPMMSIKKTEKKKRSKQLTIHSFLMSSEPRPGPIFSKIKSDLIFFPIICVIFYIPNSLNYKFYVIMYRNIVNCKITVFFDR